jgi:hypothetical protein
MVNPQLITAIAQHTLTSFAKMSRARPSHGVTLRARQAAG